jgi:hypothetical protein
MTVLEIADFTTKTVGDVSSEMVDFAKDAIRLKYKTLYDAHAWRESMRTLEGLIVDPTQKGSIFLPYDCEESIFLSLSRDGLNYTRLNYRERDWIERITGPIYSLPGNIPFYYRGENLAWPVLNPGKFTFTTSEVSSFTVYIEGKDTTGYPVNESFILQGTLNPDGSVNPKSVSTVNTYSVVTSLSKTGGILIVQPEVGSQIIFPAAVSSMVFTQFILYPSPIFTHTDGSNWPLYARTQVKLKADSLDNDMSVPRISHIWDALIEFTLSALYTKARQLAKADAREQKAIAHVQAAVNLEKNQSESHQQVIPIIYESGSYLDRETAVSSSLPFG